jgi:hypothetical protein
MCLQECQEVLGKVVGRAVLAAGACLVLGWVWLSVIYYQFLTGVARRAKEDEQYWSSPARRQDVNQEYLLVMAFIGLTMLVFFLSGIVYCLLYGQRERERRE